MRRFVGLAVLLIGLAHVVFVFATMRGPLAAIGRDGVLDAIGPNTDWEAAFWSFWFGVLLATVESLIHRITSQGGMAPPFSGWVLLGLGVVGGILMPIGPFWIAIPLGLLILVPSRRGISAAS